MSRLSCLSCPSWRLGPRKVARLLVFALLQLALVLAVSEVALRLLRPHNASLRTLLYEPTTPARFQEIDSLPALLNQSPLGYRPYEEFAGFVLNSRSFRTKEYSTRKEPGSYRVLAMGDSFTFGSGGLPHPQHWPTLLEDGLSKRRDGRVEVLRLGVGATETQFQLRLWQLEGASLEADAVVLGFFVGNDFIEAQGELARLFPHTFGDRVASFCVTYRLARNLLRLSRGTEGRSNFHSAPAAPAAPDGRRGGYELVAYRDQFDPELPTMTPDAYLRIESRRMSLTLVELEPQFRTLFDRVAGTLEALSAEVTGTGARFIVLIIPDEYQVDPAVRDAVLRATRASPKDYDLDRPQRMLAEFLGERGIEFVDLLPAFRRKAPSGRLYRLRDSHWNADGNALAAQVLLDYWDEN